jgi:hypothetical protein
MMLVLLCLVKQGQPANHKDLLMDYRAFYQLLVIEIELHF